MKIMQKIKEFRHKAYIFKFCHMPIKQNKIIFWSDSFKHFGCSPKYITLYLLNHYPGKFDIVWVFEDGIAIPNDLPNEIRVVKYFSIDYLRELHTAKFVICNMRTGDAYYWKKRDEQIYIQTWHGFLALKKIEKDAEKHLPEEYILNAQEDSKKIDLLLAGCEYSTEMFRRCFWYEGEILKGLPRCDILVSESLDVKKKVYEYYHIPKDNKLLIYAPTFRNGNKAEIFGMDFLSVISVLNSKADERWVIGCRLHPNVLADIDDDICISMSKYSDMQELLLAADILITDYSSTMFEMALAKKPCILYAPDLDEYMSNERGFYFDIRALPFPLAKNIEQLKQAIKKFDSQEYVEKADDFLNKIGSYETGNSSKQVAEYILKHMNTDI